MPRSEPHGSESNPSPTAAQSGEHGLRSLWAHPVLPVVLLTLLAAVLRFMGLDKESLSHDELSTWARTSYEGLAGVLHCGVRTDFHPPGHFVLIWLLKQVGLDSAMAMRLPSAIAGTLAVPVFIRVGVRLFDRSTALLAGLFMAVSWCMVYYSQDARAYALLVLTTLLTLDAAVVVVRGLREGGRPGNRAWLELILWGIVTAYLHYYGLFFVGLLGIGSALVLLPDTRSAGRVLAGFGAIGLSYLPWLGAFFEDLGRSSTWLPRHGIEFFPQWWKWIFGNVQGPAELAAAFLCAGAVWGLWRLWKHRPSVVWGSTALVALWLAIPPSVAFLKSMVSTPAMSKKTLLMCAPAAYFLVALSIHRMPIHRLGRWFVGVTLAGFMLMDLFFTKAYFQEPHKRQYREAAAAVIDTGGDPLIAACGIRDHFDYYLDRMGNAQVESVLCKMDQLPGFISTVEAVGERPIVYMWAHRRPEPEVREYIESRFEVTADEQFKGARVLWLRVSPDLEPLTIPEGVTARPPPPPITGPCAPEPSALETEPEGSSG